MKKSLLRVNSRERASNPIYYAVILVLVAIVIVAFVVFLYPKIQSVIDPSRIIIRNMEENVIVELVQIMYLPFTKDDFQKALSNGDISFFEYPKIREKGAWTIGVRVCLMDGTARCLPEDGGFEYITSLHVDEKCGVPVTMSVINTTTTPTIPSAEAGVKTYFHPDGWMFIGDGNCELGEFYKFKEASGSTNFVRDILGASLERLATYRNCTIGVLDGGDYTFEDCADSQWTKLVTRSTIGPAPNPLNRNLHFLVVAGTNQNTNMFSSGDYPELALLEGFLDRPEGLTKEVLQEMSAVLEGQNSHFSIQAPIQDPIQDPK